MQTPFKRAPLAAAVLAALSFPAQADLVQYAFTSVAGEERSLAPSTTSDPTYANPAGVMRFALSAGLDRKVRVTLLSQDGSTTLSSATSGIIGAANRISVESSEYYGAWLELPVPAEGEYQVRSEILSTSNAVVSTDTHRLVIDLTPPNLGDFSISFYYGKYHTDGKPIISNKERNVSLPAEDASGVAEAFYENFLATGELQTSGSVNVFDNYVALGSSVMDGLGATNALIPVNSENYFIFNVIDRAGNRSHKRMDFYNSNACGSRPEPVALFDPDYTGSYLNISALSGYREISAASSNFVKALPQMVLYRMPKNHYKGNNSIFGIYFMDVNGIRGFDESYHNKVLHEDGENVYVATPVPFQGNGSTSIAWRQEHVALICGYLSVPNLSVPNEYLPPTLRNYRAYIDDYGWVGRTFYAFADLSPPVPLNTKISKVEVTVDARSYDQRWNRVGSCTIPAGATQCTANTNISFNVQNARASISYSGGSVYMLQDSRIKSNPLSYAWVYDREFPEFKRIISHDTDNKIIVFEVYDHEDGGVFAFNTGGIDAKNASGESIRLTAHSKVTSNNFHRLSVSYKDLPEGNYDFFAWAIDAYKNETKDVLLLSGISLDNTSPSIIFSVSPDSSIATLDQLEVTVSDNVDSAPQILSANLVGGPTNDNINLTPRLIEGNRYALEYPVMFPSEGMEGSYTLTVTARDAQNNQKTETLTFSFEPAIVPPSGGLGEKLFWPRKTLPVSSMSLKTDPIRLRDSTLLQGTYDVQGTLRSDSASALSINGVSINPGETKLLGQINFTASEGRIDIPLSVAHEAPDGIYHVLLTILAPNSPMVQAMISTWSLQATDAEYEDEVRLSWTNPDPQMRYVVFRDGVALGAQTSNLSYIDRDVARGRTYNYEIQGIYNNIQVPGRPADPGSIPPCRAARFIGADLSADSQNIVGLLERLPCLTDAAMTGRIFSESSSPVSINWGGQYGNFTIPVPDEQAAGAYTLELTIDSGNGVLLNKVRTYEAQLNLSYDHLAVKDLNITHKGQLATEGMETDSIGRFGVSIGSGSGVGMASKEN